MSSLCSFKLPTANLISLTLKVQSQVEKSSRITPFNSFNKVFVSLTSYDTGVCKSRHLAAKSWAMHATQVESFTTLVKPDSNRLF